MTVVQRSFMPTAEMGRSRFLRTTAIVSLTSLLSLTFPDRVEADTITWRENGSSNRWNTTESNWRNPGNINFVDGDDVVFDTTDPDGPIEIVPDGGGAQTVEVGSISITATGIDIQNGTINGGGAAIDISITEDAEIGSAFADAVNLSGDADNNTLTLSGISAGAGTLTIGGGAANPATAAITGTWGGDVTTAAGGTLDLDGTVNGTVTVINTTTARIGGNIGVDLIANAGSTIDFDDTSVITGAFNNNAGAEVFVDADVSATDLNNNATLTVDLASESTLTVTNTITNTNAGAATLTNNWIVDGSINSGDTLDLNGGAGGKIEVTGNVEVTGGTADLQGDIGGDLTISAGTIDVTNELIVAGDIELTGTMVADQAVSATAANVGAGGDLTVDSTFTGDINLNTATSTVDVNGADDATDEVDGNITATAGVLNLEGDVSGDVAVGAAVTFTQTNALDIGGDLDIDQGFSVTQPLAADNINTSAAFSMNAGDVVTVDGRINNTGGLLTIGTGSTVNGNVRNVANIDLDGEVTGDVTLTTGSVANIAGDIGGDLNVADGSIDVDGTLNVAGTIDATRSITLDTHDVTANRVETAGVLAVNAGRTLNVTTDIVVENAGTLSGAGQVNGDIIVNAGGTLNLLSAQTGDINSNGTFTEGNTTGDVTIQGGTATLDGAYGSLTLNGGTITVAGDLNVTGAFDNSTTVALGAGEDLTAASITNGGTLTIGNGASASSTGAFTNETGGNLNLSAGGSLADDVSNAGTMTIASGATYGTGAETISNSGNLVSSGVIDGDVVGTGGDVDINGGVGGATEITGDLTLNNTGGGASGTATLSGDIAGNFANNTGTGGDVVTNNGAMDVVGNFTNSGQFRVGAGMTAGTITNTGTIVVDSDLDSDTGTIDNDGTLAFNAGGTTTNDVDNAGTLSVSGTVDGDVTSTAGLVNMNGGGEVSGDVTITGGDSTLVGTIGGDLDVSGAGSNENDGVLDVVGAFTNDGDYTVNAGMTAGTVTNTDDLTVGATGTLASDDGNIANTGGDLVVAGTVSSDVTNTAAGSVVVNGAGQIDGDLLSSTGSINVDGEVTGDVRINGGSGAIDGTIGGDVIANSTTGTLEFNGASDVAGNVIVLADATAEASANLTTTVINNEGTFTQSAGTIEIDDIINSNLMTLSGTVDAAAGAVSPEILVDATGDLTITGTAIINVDIRNQGILRIDGAAGGTYNVIDDGGSLISTGTLPSISVNGGDVNHDGTVTGDVDISTGNLSLGGLVQGNMTLSGGTTTLNNPVQVDGTFTNDAGNSFDLNDDLTAGMVVNDGTVTVENGATLTGTTSFENAGTMTVDAGGTIDGAVDNTGDLTVNGEVDGTLTSSATLDFNGTSTGDVTVTAGTAGVEGTVGGDLNLEGGDTTLTGALTVDGVFDNDATTVVDQTVTADTLENGGDLTIAAGSELTATNGATNEAGGALVVAGTLDGDTTNAGDMTVNVAGIVDGDLDATGGTLDHNGTTTGDLTVNGGAAELQGTVDGDLNIQTATATQTNTLTVGGELDVDASFNVASDLTATDVNNTAALSVSSGATLTSANRVTNDSTLTVEGTLAGSVQNTGTMTVASGGEVTAGIVMSGASSLDVDGTVSAVTINDGFLQLNNTATGDVVLRSGLAVLAGSVGGDVLHEGGDLTFNNGANIAGTIDTTFGFSTNANFAAGEIVNDAGVVSLGGDVAAPMTTGATGTTTVSGNLTGAVDNAGTTNVEGSVTGAVTNTGTTNVSGAVTGNVDNDGTAILSGSVIGDVDTSDTLTFTGAAGTVDGAVTNSGTLNVGSAATATVSGTTTNTGTLNVDGTLDGHVANSGDFSLSGTTTSEVDNNSGGTLTVDGSATSNGDVSNRGIMTVGTGFDLTANNGVESAGTLTIDGTVTGNVEVSGGTTTIGSGGNVIGTFSVLDGGAATVDGTITGPVSALFAVAPATSALTNAGDTDLSGAVAGDVQNEASGTLTVTGASTVSGTVTNLGTFDINSGLTGWTDFENDGTATIASGVTTSGGSFNNNAAGTLNLIGTLDADIVNAGTVELSSSGVFGGSLTNSGTINADSGLTFGGNVSQTGTIDLADGAVGDAFRVNGDLDFGTTGRVEIDVDLAAGSGGTTFGSASDFIVVTGGATTGTVELAFNTTGTEFGDLDEDGIRIINADESQSNSYTVRSSGLPTNGALLYVFETVGDDTILTTTENPAIGGIAGTVALTQSLIGSVVNRPSSPFVSGLAQPGDKPCGPGGWARATGGVVEASGGVTNDEGNFDVNISANYYGIQFGGDFGCFAGHFNGWDLAFGAIGGVNYGATEQDIFAFDSNTGAFDTSIRTAVVTTDFTQAYGGVYVAAARGPLVADLQYRVENTAFDLSTENLDDTFVGGIGVEDQSFDSNAQTISGSVSYAFPINEELGIVAVPTIGFAFSNITTGEIDFAGDAVLVIEDSQSRVGFLGGTVARRQVADNGLSALTYFGTATVYSDFADGPQSTFFFSDDRDPRVSTAENLGTYGEISAGVSYIRLLEPGQLGSARQLNASVRADARFGEQLESFGITGQVRIQF